MGYLLSGNESFTLVYSVKQITDSTYKDISFVVYTCKTKALHLYIPLWSMMTEG